MIALVLADGRVGKERRCLQVLRHCRDLMPDGFFGEIMLFSPVEPFPCEGEGVTWVETALASTDEYTRFSAYEMIDHIPPTVTHVLLVQLDGFISTPEKWSEEFLDYDYIGSPWMAHQVAEVYKECRVGNSGFCLRTTRFMEACRDELPRDDCDADDVWFGQHHRAELEALGMKYAPLDVAGRFGSEFDIDELPHRGLGDVFGFHSTSTSERTMLAHLVATGQTKGGG